MGKAYRASSIKSVNVFPMIIFRLFNVLRWIQ